jgi:flagellar hook-basal body complex protein FliE
MQLNNNLQINSIFNKVTDLHDINGSKNTEEGLSFLDTLKQKLDEVNGKQLQSEQVTEAFIKGEDVEIHEVMLAGEEAKLSLQMAVQVRNKLVEAYQELNRMQL